MQRIRYSRYLKSVFLLIDIISICSVFVYFFSIKNPLLVNNKNIWFENIVSLILLSIFWILLSEKTKIYKIQRNLTYTIFLERIIIQTVFFSLGTILISRVTKNVFFTTHINTLLFSLGCLLIFIKTILFVSVKYIRSRGINFRNVMFIFEDSSTDVLKSTFLERSDYGYKIFEYPQKKIELNSLIQFWKKNGIHTIYLPVDAAMQKENQELLKSAEENRVHISLIPNINQDNSFLYDLTYIQTQPVLVQKKNPLDYFSNYSIKKLFDIIFSVLILACIGSWLFPIIALIIKITSKGPVFFIQKRYGFHENIFNCIKFRTMVVNTDSSIKTTKENDNRITKFGKFLRKTSLDEMPQFINVLKGEMSVVGPRPHMLVVDDYYKTKIERYNLRSSVFPGITGLAQVNGLRGDFGDVEIEMNKRVLADTFYVRNWTFILDLVIIFKTIFLVIAGDKNAK